MAAREDRFANIAAARVVESAAGTLTFTEMLTGISLGQGVGMIIDQISYYLNSAAIQDLVASQDAIVMGITASDDVADLTDVTDRRILHATHIETMMVGAVVSLSHLRMPFDYQFFPPMIFASPRLHLGVIGLNLAGAVTARCRIYFRYISLTPQQYLELAEAFVLTG